MDPCQKEQVISSISERVTNHEILLKRVEREETEALSALAVLKADIQALKHQTTRVTSIGTVVIALIEIVSKLWH
jgi:hypothetical protein